MLQVTDEGRRLIREALGSSLYQQRKPVTLPLIKAAIPKRRKLQRQSYDRLLNLTVSVLKTGTFSKFEFEGPCRNGLRSHLVEQGWRHREAEDQANEIVAKGLNIIGAVRPNVWEGQLDYTYEGLILRTHCKYCHGPLPDDRSMTDTRWKYCCRECSQAYAKRLKAITHTFMTRTEWFVHQAAKSERTRQERSGNCEICGTFFIAKLRGRRFCSRACAAIGHRVVDERPCEVCSKVFKPIAGKAGRFCSVSCVEEDRLAGRAEVSCLQCGEPFMRQNRSDKREYCSTRCAGRARGSAKRVERPTLTCEHCRQSFQPKRANAPARFCSQPCRNAAFARPKFTCQEITS